MNGRAAAFHLLVGLFYLMAENAVFYASIMYKRVCIEWVLASEGKRNTDLL